MEKLSSPEIVAELILDDHGNYVIQKVLQCADEDTKENILKNIIPLIPKIKEVTFGERLLNRLYISYPQLNSGNSKKKIIMDFIIAIITIIMILVIITNKKKIIRIEKIIRNNFIK